VRVCEAVFASTAKRKSEFPAPLEAPGCSHPESLVAVQGAGTEAASRTEPVSPAGPATYVLRPSVNDAPAPLATERWNVAEAPEVDAVTLNEPGMAFAVNAGAVATP
jgi:hypothetical protein